MHYKDDEDGDDHSLYSDDGTDDEDGVDDDAETVPSKLC